MVNHEKKKLKARGYPKILGVVLAGLGVVLSYLQYYLLVLIVS